MKPHAFLDQLRHDDVVGAIHDAEQQTSGEIRVFVSHRTIKDPVTAAQRAFVKLGMTRTRERNGVLIFVAPRSHTFAVIGDAAVHQRCGDEFWRQLAAEMTGHFRKAEFTDGILHAIRRAGRLLAEHVPPGPDDRNELPDTVAHD